MQRSLRTQSTVLLIIAMLGVSTSAQEVVTLEPGLVFSAKTRKSVALSSDRKLQGPGKNGYYLVIDQRYKYYFVPNKLVRERVPQAFAGESFKIKHKTVAARRIPEYIGGFLNVTPFDKHGVRTVTLRTPKGPKAIIQGISELNPEYVWIKSLDHRWQFGIPTTSLDDDVLSKALLAAIDETDPLDRLGACAYIIKAGKLDLAGRWLAEIEKEFPAFKQQCKATNVKLRLEYARQVIEELGQRKLAGQHALVQRSLAAFPTSDLSQAVLNQVELLQKEYKVKQTAIDTIHDHIEKLEAAVDPKLAEQLAPCRDELKRHLGFSSLDRLQAYINLSKDKTLKPEERLSIAYSGWLLGSAGAITSIQETLGLWAARDHVATYIHSADKIERQRALDALNRLEGVTPRAVVQLLETSPPLPPTRAVPGQVVPVQMETEYGSANYKVILPPEYSPYKEYPMIVTLRQANLSAEAALQWWELQAQRRGYIVIAPDYLAPGEVGYTSNPRSHAVVLASIRDAFSRFNVDTDRVFLTGHGAGGDATFDIGMSHPDVFAGAIPICGLVGPECAKLTTNGARLPWYVVSGQRHRNSLAHNSFVLHQIAVMKKNWEVIVCEYKDRGFESYYDEIQNLFTWMQSHERDAIPKAFEVSTVRPENGQFYWLEASDFPKLIANQNFDRDGGNKKPIKSLDIKLKVTRKNSITIEKRGGADKITIRLFDAVVDFAKFIRVTGAGVPRGTRINPKPSVEDVLDDFRIYRDRKRVALQRVVL
jgi:pimeloyl-ACP methyl ester carboxylesterase